MDPCEDVNVPAYENIPFLPYMDGHLSEQRGGGDPADHWADLMILLPYPLGWCHGDNLLDKARRHGEVGAE